MLLGMSKISFVWICTHIAHILLYQLSIIGSNQWTIRMLSKCTFWIEFHGIQEGWILKHLFNPARNWASEDHIFSNFILVGNWNFDLVKLIQRKWTLGHVNQNRLRNHTGVVACMAWLIMSNSMVWFLSVTGDPGWQCVERIASIVSAVKFFLIAKLAMI